MKRLLRKFAALLLSLPAGFVAAESPPLGRLFTTPEHRSALDRQRIAGELPSAEDAALRVNGLVRRSSGRHTAWLNGRPQTGIPTNGDDLILRLHSEADARLRVGDALDRSTGEVRPLIEPGGIVIHPDRRRTIRP